MIYLAAVIVLVWQSALGGSFSFLGGPLLIVPALIFVAASYNDWFEWIIWVVVLAASRFFNPFPWTMYLAILLGSYATYWLTRRWVDLSTIWLPSVALTLILILVLLSMRLPPPLSVIEAYGGSLIATWPFIAIIIWIRQTKRTS